MSVTRYEPATVTSYVYMMVVYAFFKGGSILRMMRFFLGDNVFQTALKVSYGLSCHLLQV